MTPPAMIAMDRDAKGKLSRERLDEVTAAIDAQLHAGGAHVDRTYYCLHHPDAVFDAWRGDCPNRKPNPGMLLQAACEFGVDPAQCWFIDDTHTDIRAGRAAGFRDGVDRSPTMRHLPNPRRCGT